MIRSWKNIHINDTFHWLSSFIVVNTYKTSGGHPSATGAPGEKTCADATTGCHSNAAIVKDTTNVVNTFIFSSIDSSYTPNQTYNITLNAQKSAITKFGFEIVALTKSNNANAGTWVITDANRTHTLVGSAPFSSRKYVTHSSNGTPAVSSGLGQWTFIWKAPSSNMGKITFYYTTSCTNNNGANTGEQLFLSNFEIHPSAPASIGQFIEKSKFSGNYDEVSGKLSVKYFMKRPPPRLSILLTSRAKWWRVLHQTTKMVAKFPMNLSCQIYQRAYILFT